jgi:hypothetical protein
MKTLFIILCFAVAFISCTNSSRNSITDKTALLIEDKKVVQSFMEQLSKIDTSFILNFISANPDFTALIDSSMVGRDDFKTIVRQILPGFTRQTFENISERYVIIGPDLFIYNYKSLNKMYDKSGVITTINPICGSYTFQKEQDGWKIINMHETWNNMKVDSSMVKK